MIPLSVEQASGRDPVYQVLISWGGDLALATGLIGVSASASSAAVSHGASLAIDGDKTLLNNSWWESTNTGGRSFSIDSTPGGFIQEFQNLDPNTQVIFQVAGVDAFSPITLGTGSNYFYEFNGTNDKVTFPAPTYLPLGNTDRSVSIWYSPSIIAGERPVFSWGHEAAGLTLFALTSLSSSSSTMSVWWYDNKANGNIPLTEGILYHIAVTYDSATNNLRTYINDALDINVTIVGGLNTSNTQFAFGWSDGGNLNFGAGKIRNTAIYNRVLSPTEVSDLYGTGYAPAATLTIGSGANFSIYAAGHIWVSNYNSSSVSKIDPSTNTVVGTITGIPGNPAGMAFDGTNIWVGTGTSTVYYYDAVTLAPVGSLGGFTGCVDCSFDGTFMWISDYLANQVMKVNVSIPSIVATVNIPDSQPQALAFLDGFIFAMCFNGTNAYKINISSNTIVGTITGLSDPGIMIKVAGNYYIANYLAGNIVKIDPTLLTITATIPDLYLVWGVDTDGTTIWVAGGSKNLWLIDVATFTLLDEAVKYNTIGTVLFAAGSFWVGTYTTDFLRFTPTRTFSVNPQLITSGEVFFAKCNEASGNCIDYVGGNDGVPSGTLTSFYNPDIGTLSTSQAFIFPKNRSVYLRASVKGTTGDILIFGDTYTGHFDTYTISSTGVWELITLERFTLDGGSGDVYITYTNPPGAVEVKQLEAYTDSSCMDWVKQALSPYTLSSPTVTGTPVYTKSNLIIEPESFVHAWRFVNGATTSTDPSYPVNPEQSAGDVYRAEFVNTNSYIYTVIDNTYRGKGFTLSAWIRSDIPAQVHMGVFEDIGTPGAGQSSTFEVTTSWTRIFLTIGSINLTNGTLQEQLAVFIGTYGFNIAVDLPANNIYIWGVQLVEDGISDLHEYYKISTDIQLLSNTYQFANSPWSGSTVISGTYADEDNYDEIDFVTDNVVATYNTTIVCTGHSFIASVWAKAITTPGPIYVIFGLDDDSQYAVELINLTTEWQHFSLPITFTSTASTIIKIQLGTSGIGSYAPLANINVMVRDASVFQDDQSDHYDAIEASENLLVRSEELDHASWTKDVGVTVTADQYNNPLTFALTADKIDTTNTNLTVYQAESVVAPASNTFTFSTWVRADVDTLVDLQIKDGAGQTFTSTDFTATTQWVRISYTATFVASGAASVTAAFVIPATGATLYVWGVQLEQKSYMTPYIKTTSAAVSRAANIYHFPVPVALASNSELFTITWRGSIITDSTSSANKHVLFDLKNGSGTIEISTYIESGVLNTVVTDAAGSTFTGIINLPGNLLLSNEFSVSLTRTSSIQWQLALNSGRGTSTVIVFSTNGTVTTPTEIYLGADNAGGNSGDARVAEFIIWTKALTDSEYSTILSLDNSFIYATDTSISAIAPFLNRANDYQLAGGDVTFNLSSVTVYPGPSLISFIKNISYEEVIENVYTLIDGTAWNYNYDWLNLAFANAVAFNRVKVYQYPNRDFSLQVPYTAGKGALKDWIIEYLDATTGLYIPIYRKHNSLADVDNVDLTQLVGNGSFEINLSDWSVTNISYVTLTQYTGLVYSGTSSLRITSAASNISPLWGAKIPFFVIPGDFYTISCKVALGPDMSSGNALLQVVDDLGIISSTVVLTSGWQTITLDYIPDALLQNTSVWLKIVGSGVPVTPGTDESFLVDDVRIVPAKQSFNTSNIRISIQNTQATDDTLISPVYDTPKILEVQLFDFIDESAYVVENDIQITFKQTPQTNFIAPSYFQIRLSNTSKRYSPKNNASPIYGYTQPDGRGFVRAGSLVEIYGGYIASDGTQYTNPVLFGIVGSEQNPAATTGIEMNSSNEDILLIGGDDLMQLSRTNIVDSDVLSNKSLEELIAYLLQVAGYAIQDMQLDASGIVVPFSWFGGANVLDEINAIVAASYGSFFCSPSNRTFYYYDGVKFKSWLQTTKTDFDLGTLTNVTTSVDLGTVELDLHSTIINTNTKIDYTNTTATMGLFGLGSISLALRSVSDPGNASVKGYHFNSLADWVVINAPSQILANSAAFYGILGIRTDDAYAGNPSIALLTGLNFPPNPTIDWGFVGEDNTLISSGTSSLLNSGTAQLTITDDPHGVIMFPPNGGFVALYKIYFTITQAIYPGEYVYFRFQSTTNVPDNAGVTLSLVTLDGASGVFDLITTQHALQKLSARVAVAHQINPGTHYITISASVGIQNPAADNVTTSLFVDTTHESNLQSTPYTTGFFNYLSAGTYYYSIARNFTTGGTGALSTRSAAFVVPPSDFRPALLTISNEGNIDNNIKYYGIYAIKNPVDPDDALYRAQPLLFFPAILGPSQRLGLYYGAGSIDDRYYKPGKINFPWDNTGMGYNKVYTGGGWGVVAIPVPISSTPTKGFLVLQVPGANGIVTIQTKEPVFLAGGILTIRYMVFAGTTINAMAIDEIAYGTRTFQNSGSWQSVSIDTANTSPAWGSIEVTVGRALDASKGEKIVISSQVSSDNITWDSWVVLGTAFSIVPTFSYNIISASKRYIRFKLNLSTLDNWSTPIVSNLSFTWTLNGNIVSQVLDATATINTYNGFGATNLLPTGTTITYQTLSADSPNTTAGILDTSLDPQGWVTATPGSTIASAAKRYIQWRAYLTTPIGNITPKLLDVTINWTKGVQVFAVNRSFSYDTDILGFDPKAGFPFCNSCEVNADNYQLALATTSVPAHWNGAGGNTTETCGQQLFSYTDVLNLANQTVNLTLTLNDPAINPITSNYSTYPRAITLTIGAVTYGVKGWFSGVLKEGVTYTWTGVGGGNLSITFSGQGKYITATITATGSVSIIDISLFGYALNLASAFNPSQVQSANYKDVISVALYKHEFLTSIVNKYVSSSAAALTLAQLVVDDGRWIRDYGVCIIPVAFSLTLQSIVNINQLNVGWQMQYCQCYEVTHKLSDMTTSITVREK